LYVCPSLHGTPQDPSMQCTQTWSLCPVQGLHPGPLFRAGFLDIQLFLNTHTWFKCLSVAVLKFSFSGDGGGGVSWTICPGCTWTKIHLNSASQVAKIAGVSHPYLVKSSVFCTGPVILWLPCFFSYLFIYYWVFETGFCFVAQAGLELSILLPLLTEGWHYRHEPPHSATSLLDPSWALLSNLIVLVCWGYCNRIPCPGCLKKQKLIFS
jgi:hypothetical protein